MQFVIKKLTLGTTPRHGNKGVAKGCSLGPTYRALEGRGEHSSVAFFVGGSRVASRNCSMHVDSRIRTILCPNPFPHARGRAEEGTDISAKCKSRRLDVDNGRKHQDARAPKVPCALAKFLNFHEVSLRARDNKKSKKSSPPSLDVACKCEQQR